MIKRPLCLCLALFLTGMLLLRLLGLTGYVESSETEAYYSEKKTGTITGTVETVSDPDYSWIVLENAYFTEKQEAVYLGRVKLTGNLMVSETDESREGLLPGNVIAASGTLYPFSSASNSGQFDEKSYYRKQGINAKFRVSEINSNSGKTKVLKSFLFKFECALSHSFMSILPEKEASVVKAMLLGEKSGIDSEIKNLYAQSGISHILAISGLHISVIGYSVYSILRKCTKNSLLSVTSAIVLTVLYGIMSDFQISTRRAVIMLVVMLLSKPLGKVYDAKSAMAFSAVVILLFNPELIADASFLFSYSAVIGIFYVFPALKRRVCKKKEKGGMLLKACPKVAATAKSKITEAFLLSFSVSLTTLPASLYFYHEYHLYSVFINMLCLPLASLLFVLVLLGGMAGLVSEVLGTFFIGGGYYILKLIENICLMFKKLPFSTLALSNRVILPICILCTAALVLYVYRNKILKIICLPAILMCVIVILFGKENTVGLLDVGQGDCTHISENGINILIDGGSTDVSAVGQMRILPYLKYHAVEYIDYVFISHTDADHINGIIEILEAQSPSYGRRTKDIIYYDGIPKTGCVVLPESIRQEEDNKNLTELLRLCKEKNTQVMFISEGFSLSKNNLFIKCIAPSTDLVYNTSNDACMVLSVSLEEGRLLFPGDSGSTVLNELAGNGLFSGQYDLIKVPHHGSKYSAGEAFYDAVSKDNSLFYISCGARNVYGHPHRETISLLGMHSDSPAVISFESGGQYVCRTDSGLAFSSMIDTAGPK